MNFKKYLPFFYSIGFFFIIVLLYFLPLFQGKSIRSHDILQFQGMAEELVQNRNKYGEEPFWAASQFSGMPNTMINMNHFGNLMDFFPKIINYIAIYPSSLILICLVSFLILMISLEVNYLLALIGSIAFAFGSFNMIGLVAGHNAKLACIAYMPAVLAGLIWAFRKNKLLGTSIFAFALALQVSNNHVQITYYLSFICLTYVISEFFNAKKNNLLPDFFKTIALLTVATAIAIGTHAGYFLSLQEYGKYSIRGKMELKPLAENKEAVREDGLDRDYVFNYSSSLTEPMTFLIADYFGGASTGSLDLNSESAKALKENGADLQQIKGFIAKVPLYFGEQYYVAGPFYIGAIICFLFILGMIITKDNLKWAMLACTIVGILLMLGKNFSTLNYLLFDYFPLYNKFRSVTMAVIIPQMCMAVVVALGLKTFFETKDKKQFIKPLMIAFGATGGLSLLVFLMASTGNYSTSADFSYQMPDWLINALADDRKTIRTSDALRSFMYIVLASSIIYLLIIEKITQNLGMYGLVLLTLVDLWTVNKRYLNENQFEKNSIKNFYKPTEADTYIMQDKNPNFRVLNLDIPFNESRTSYFHKSVGGYSPAKLRRYQDLIERKLIQEMQVFIDGLKNREIRFHQTPVLNMLNTKYIMAGEDAQSVIQNDSAQGNAWFVKEIHSVNSPDEEIAQLGQHDPRHTAVMNITNFKAEQVHFLSDTNAFINLISYKPYDLTYQTSNKNEGFIVFSEVYYPKGWTATLDDKPLEIKQVNYVLRGVHIPAGNHTIKMTMVNNSYLIGNRIGFACSSLVYIGLIFALYQNFKPKKRRSQV